MVPITIIVKLATAAKTAVAIMPVRICVSTASVSIAVAGTAAIKAAIRPIVPDLASGVVPVLAPSTHVPQRRINANIAVVAVGQFNPDGELDREKAPISRRGMLVRRNAVSIRSCVPVTTNRAAGPTNRAPTIMARPAPTMKQSVEPAIDTSENQHNSEPGADVRNSTAAPS